MKKHVTLIKLSFFFSSVILIPYYKILYGLTWAYYSGKPAIFKSKQGKIRLGRSVRFQSLSWGNLIGVNHKCIISVHDRALLSVGSNTRFSGVTIGAFKEIIIGRNCKIGANCLITDSDWHSDDERSNAPRSIIIGDNVWLGYNCTILKGVRIGEGAMIGANSTVTKDVEPYEIVAGNPAKKNR